MSASSFTTENPATLDILETYQYLSDREIEARLESVVKRQKQWRWLNSNEKSQALRLFAQELRLRRESFAQLMAREMGKPLLDGRNEVEKCASTAEYYAANVEKWTASLTVDVGGRPQSVVTEPLGLILAIMPWNFPLWQVVRSFVPIVLGGNAYLLKHSDQVAGTARLLEDVAAASFGSDLLANLRIDHIQAGRVIGDRRVRGVTMTGSSRGGAQVAAIAGKHLKKCVLELGGSDPVLVLPDADLELAARLSAQSRLVNNGQSCISAKRFLVSERHQAEFVDLLAARMAEPRIGSPEEEGSQLGPLAHRRFKEKMHQQLEQIQREGARRLWIRSDVETRAAFVAPQILEASPAQASYSQEEFFAPVALVTSYADENEMLELANATLYGLGATVVTSDPEAAERLIPQLECGTVAVNRIVQSEARLPFGGVKDSGFGRELSGEGVREFLSLKTILR